MSQPKVKTEVTPKGVFVYPCLNRPDTKFDDAGVYSVKLKLDADAATPLKTRFDELIEAQVKKVQDELAAEGKKKKVKCADTPYYEDEETGEVTFNFKMKASGKRKDKTTFTQKPGLKSSVADPVTKQPKDIPEDVIIGGGSEGKVAFSFSPFYVPALGAGVSLRLKAVQVFKLVEPSYSYGFEAEECEEESEGADTDDAPFDGDTDTGSDDGDF